MAEPRERRTPRDPRRRPPPSSDPRRRRPADISRAPKPPPGNVIPFRQNIPKKLARRNENLVIYYDQLRNVISLEIIVTFALVVFAAVFVTGFHALNTGVSTEITRATQQLRSYQTNVFNLTAQLADRYTSYEIERVATERLDMGFPDPSQIIHIEVHRQGTVMLVPDYLVAQPITFWQSVSNFISDTINNIFGGGS